MPTLPNLPAVISGAGIVTPYGIVLPPGGRVAGYVRSTGVQSLDDAQIRSRLFLTLDAALQECRSGLNDFVIVLPGHAENISTTFLANLKAGTKIIGVGTGSAMPTFTFSATGSTMAVAVADCQISGCKFTPAAGIAVTKAFYITGADFRFSYNEIVTSISSSAKMTIVMDFDTGAARFIVEGNKIYGLLAGVSTTGIVVTAALSDWEIKGNRMTFPSTATTIGLIHVSGAALNGYIGFNSLYNTVAASTVCIYFADVASDGLCEYNSCAETVGTATAPNVSGIVLAGTNTLWRFDENYSTPTKNTSGDITPVRDT